MQNPFTISKSLQEGISIISLAGYLDAHTAPLFEQAIQSEIDANHFRIIVDCEGLTYISSAGLGVFMSYIEEIRENEGDIKICGIIPKVRQVFEILGFPSLFDILDDVPTAIRYFAESPTRNG